MDRDERRRDLTRARVRRYRRMHKKENSDMPSPEFEDSNIENRDDNEHSPANVLPAYSRTSDSDTASVVRFSPETITSDSEEDAVEQYISDSDSVHIEEDLQDLRGAEPELNETDELRSWAVTCNIPHVHLDKLLVILRQRLLPDLPRSAKTFLRCASADYNIEHMEDSNGHMLAEFCYFGIGKGLKVCVVPELHPCNMLHLQFNVDGLPLFESSSKQFWPILCKVHCNDDVYKPFAVAIYSGNSKPKSVLAYLQKFIAEMNQLAAEGILIGQRHFQVRIKCFICDTPARSFLKCIKGHGGYFACERCTIRGTRNRRRTIYPSADSTPRTNDSIRQQVQPDHHAGVSPLEALIPAIDMASVFVLDFMHLCCVGVMKKLITEYWMKGDFNVRLGHREKDELSRRMECLKSQVPCEFQRKPRSVKLAAKWKATEFRFFLLYCGPIVLKRILKPKLYKHFVLLHVACRILCSKELAIPHNSIAKEYLRNFFLLLGHYYGPQSQVINAHNLIHLADDVMNMGCSLSEISAFPFENLLGEMKKLLRGPNRPLVQLCRRLHEKDTFTIKKRAATPSDVVILKWKTGSDTPGHITILKIRYIGTILSIKPPNDLVQLKDGKVLKIQNMHMDPRDSLQSVVVHGVIWKVKQSLFTYPCDSRELDIMELHDSPSQTSAGAYNVKSIRRKMVKLAFAEIVGHREKIWVLPLLHN